MAGQLQGNNNTSEVAMDQTDGGASYETPQERLQRLAQYIVKGEQNRDQQIDTHFRELKKFISSKFGLLDKLVSLGVIDDMELAEITGTGTGERTVYQQNHVLLGILRQVTDDKYLKFLEALAEKQMDLVQMLTGNEWNMPDTPNYM